MAHLIQHALFSVSLSLALVGACGGDTDVQSPDGSGGADASSSTGDTSGSTGSGDSGASTGSGEQNACGIDSIDMADPCETCIASQCTAEALACCQAPGCLEVVRCAADKGCDGVSCYSPEMCQAEIDAAGIDVASNQATALGACALSSCATECGQDGGGGAGGSE